ncbi:MAG: hypothetical protein PSU94_10450 [Lacunisphaera sp.]|nr:hypothetical protein [Lacunisphaera sp.]
MTKATFTGVPPRPAPNSSRSLWLWVGGAFLLLCLVWAVLFTVAHGAKVDSVPLATKGGRP